MFNVIVLDGPNSQIVHAKDLDYDTAIEIFDFIVETKTETAPAETIIPKTIPVEGKEVKKETKYGVSLTDVENISENLEIGKTEENTSTPNSSLFDE
jgi:hypothetical protein